MDPLKIVVAMPAEEEFMPSISRWGHEYVWTKKVVYFVHVVREDVYISDRGVEKILSKEEKENMRQHTLDFIKNKASEMIPLSVFKKAQFEVIFAQNPADRLAKYAKEIHAGMIVVATRNKKGFAGFFLSSFADRIISLSPCDVLVLRPK